MTVYVIWFNEESIHIYSFTTDLILPAVLSTDCRILEDSWETDVSNKLSSTACKRTTIRTVSINNLPNKQHPVNKTRRLSHLNHIISSFHITTNTPGYTEQDILIWSHKHTLTNKQHTWNLLNHSLTHIHKNLKDERSDSYRSHLVTVPSTSAQGRLRVQAVRGPRTKLHWSAIDLWGFGMNYRRNLSEV